jgi:hypothetical protein
MHAVVVDFDGRCAGQNLFSAPPLGLPARLMDNAEERRSGPHDCSHPAWRWKEGHRRRLWASVARHDRRLIESPKSSDLIAEQRRSHSEDRLIVSECGAAAQRTCDDAADLHDSPASCTPLGRSGKQQRA